MSVLAPYRPAARYAFATTSRTSTLSSVTARPKVALNRPTLHLVQSMTLLGRSHRSLAGGTPASAAGALEGVAAWICPVRPFIGS